MKNALLALLLLAPLTSLAQTEPATGFVYVVKPGKTGLRAEPKLDSAAKGQVQYGQKLALKEKTDGGWLKVAIPGDPNTGWIQASTVLDKRPTVDHKPISGGSAKVAAGEMSTAGAIRGLDKRTAVYAADKQIPANVLEQVGKAESFGEQLFADRHFTDAKGQWRYADVTAPGRAQAAKAFAAPEGLRGPK